METSDDAAPFELAAAAAGIVLSALVTAALFAPGEPVARAVCMAVAAGMLARWVRDWRVALAVPALAGLIHVGFLVHRFGDLTAGPVPWAGLGLIAAAALLGRLRLPQRRPHTGAVVNRPGLPAHSSRGARTRRETTPVAWVTGR